MQKTGKSILWISIFIALLTVMGCGSLSQAVIEADMVAVQAQVQGGKSVNAIDKWGWTPLLWAVYYNYYQISEYLLEKGADPNIKSVQNQGAIPMGSTPLLVASYYGNAKIVELLLKHGADQNIRNNAGNTAHDVAAKYNFIPVLELMAQDRKNNKP